MDELEMKWAVREHGAVIAKFWDKDDAAAFVAGKRRKNRFLTYTVEAVAS